MDGTGRDVAIGGVGSGLAGAVAADAAGMVWDSLTTPRMGCMPGVTACSATGLIGAGGTFTAAGLRGGSDTVAAAPNLWPQPRQNLASALFGALHFGQCFCTAATVDAGAAAGVFADAVADDASNL
jgi:hypothetical protein